MGEALERKYFDGQKKVLRQLFNQKQEMLKKRMNYQFQREIAIILSEVKAEYAKKFLDFTDNTEEKYNVSTEYKKMSILQNILCFSHLYKNTTQTFLFLQIIIYYLLNLFSIFMYNV